MIPEEKLLLKRSKQLHKILTDKSVNKIESISVNKIKVYFDTGAIFICSGPLVEDVGIMEYERKKIGLCF